MSMDHRTIKSLLQAQLAPKLDFGATSRKAAKSSSADESQSIFDTILTARLGGGAVSPAQEESGSLPVWSDNNTLWAQLASFNIAPSGTSSELAGANGGWAREASAFTDLIREAAAKYGVSPVLIQAVIATESGFDPGAQSHAGAKGLMQLMDGTARGLGVTDSFDPAQNIDGGTKYLALLLRKYGGSEAIALAAYNGGPGRIDRLGIVTEADLAARFSELPEETQRYIAKVQSAKL